MQFSKIAAVLAFAMSVSAIPVAEPAIAIRGPLLGGDDNSDNSDNSSDDDQINQCSGGLNYCKQGNRWSKGGQNCRNGEVYCCNNSNKIVSFISHLSSFPLF